MGKQTDGRNCGVLVIMTMIKNMFIDDEGYDVLSSKDMDKKRLRHLRCNLLLFLVE